MSHKIKSNVIGRMYKLNMGVPIGFNKDISQEQDCLKICLGVKKEETTTPPLDDSIIVKIEEKNTAAVSQKKDESEIITDTKEKIMMTKVIVGLAGIIVFFGVIAGGNWILDKTILKVAEAPIVRVEDKAPQIVTEASVPESLPISVKKVDAPYLMPDASESATTPENVLPDVVKNASLAKPSKIHKTKMAEVKPKSMLTDAKAVSEGPKPVAGVLFNEPDEKNTKPNEQTVTTAKSVQPVAAPATVSAKSNKAITNRLIAVTADSKYAVFSDPKTKLPVQFEIGQALPTGESITSIDAKSGKVTTSTKEYKLD